MTEPVERIVSGLGDIFSYEEERFFYYQHPLSQHLRRLGIMTGSNKTTPTNSDDEADGDKTVLNEGDKKTTLSEAVRALSNSVIAMQKQQADLIQNVDMLIRNQRGQYFDGTSFSSNPVSLSSVVSTSASVSNPLRPPFFNPGACSSGNVSSLFGVPQNSSTMASVFGGGQSAFSSLFQNNSSGFGHTNPTSASSTGIPIMSAGFGSHTFGSHSFGYQQPTFSFDPTYSMPLPNYDPACMTPEHFVQEITEYFHLRHIPQQSWLLLVSRMFKVDSDIARWWRETRFQVHSWAEFLSQFFAYERAGQSKDNLSVKLYGKTQRIDEPFESFAWDLHALFRKIEPNVDTQLVISRILNACLPEIAVHLRQFSFTSINELNSKARAVIADVNRLRKLQQKQLLRARQSDPIGEVETSRVTKPTSQFPYKTRDNWYTRKSAQTINSPSIDKSSVSNSVSDISKSDNTPSSGETKRFSEKDNCDVTDPKGRRSDQPSSSRACFYCGNLGHRIAECRKKKWADSQAKKDQDKGKKKDLPLEKSTEN
jgi:hypothetical protein